MKSRASPSLHGHIDQSVVERAPIWHQLLRHARVYQAATTNACGAALKNYRNKVYISSKTPAKDRKSPWIAWMPA